MTGGGQAPLGVPGVVPVRPFGDAIPRVSGIPAFTLSSCVTFSWRVSMKSTLLASEAKLVVVAITDKIPTITMLFILMTSSLRLGILRGISRVLECKVTGH